MGPTPTPTVKESSSRRMRTGSNSATPGSNTVSDTSRKQARSSQSPARSFKRISKARKSLNFDNVPPKRASILENQDEIVPLPDGLETTRIPPIAHFWANPPPLPSEVRQPTFDDQFSTGPQPQRRSERLILKGSQFKGGPPIAESDPESRLLPAPAPSTSPQHLSQLPFLPFTEFKCPSTDTQSVHSDYGTSSENSFNFTSRKRKHGVSRNIVTRKRTTICNDISPGYISDIDEGVESFSESQEQSHSWDSDDEARTSNVLLSESQEWDRAVENEASNSSHHSVTSSYLNISNLSGPVKIGVKWVASQGIHVVVPLEGNEIPSNFQPKPPQLPLLEDEDCPGPYDTRKKTRYRPKHPTPSPFEIRTFPSTSIAESFRRSGLRLLAASPVISLEPKGTKFCELYPAVISIPLETLPVPGDEIYCLYTDDPKVEEEIGSETDPSLTWSILHDVQITLEGERLTFETYEFCSFIVVIREKPIETQKQIRARIGGKLLIPEIPGAEISFSKGSVLEDVTVNSKVFLDTEMGFPDFMSKGKMVRNQDSPLTIATPILMMEPHGINFEPDLVTIQLPIPDYDQILELFGPLARLQILQSCTIEDEPTEWEPVNVHYEIHKIKLCGHQPPVNVISFKVSHFSFFKVVWDIISASLYEARVGMSYFHNFVAFSMKCQANMEESGDSRFALEITCYRSDKRFPEFTNYRYRVGCSSKPKNIRPGKIFVRLKSSYFDADVDAGEAENKSLEKVEEDFRGRDFAMQYCCKFKTDKAVDRGPFGKVIVHRFVKVGQEELLFEFNLQKSGHEGEKTPNDQNDRWSILALQELAASLFVTDGENWKAFASHIGFTKQEVKNYFKNSPEPFVEIINRYQHRGGTPDEFVQALYAVNRELKINNLSSPSSSRKSRSSNCSSGRGSMTMIKNQHLSDSDTSGTRISQDSLLTGTTRKRSNPSLNRSSGNGSSSKTKRKHKRRKLALPRSEDDETTSERESVSSSSSSSDSEVDKEEFSKANTITSGNNSSINQRNDLTKLEASFLWEISAHMDGQNWRALGRTLGIQESILLNTDHTHRTAGFRECAYQMLLVWKERFPKKCTFGVLYSALCKEDMNSVAKKMIQVRRND